MTDVRDDFKVRKKHELALSICQGGGGAGSRREGGRREGAGRRREGVGCRIAPNVPRSTHAAQKCTHTPKYKAAATNTKLQLKSQYKDTKISQRPKTYIARCSQKYKSKFRCITNAKFQWSSAKMYETNLNL